MARARRSDDTVRRFWIGLARAFGGAIVFSLPIFMTMEMWFLGVTMDRFRLALMLALGVPLLVGLARYIGYEETFSLRDDVVDAFVAYAVGFVAGAAVLAVFNIIRPDQSVDEIVGMVSLQALAGGIGALLAQNQFGQTAGEGGPEERRLPGYASEVFVMGVGAVFLAFNVAPTEEIVVIAFAMSVWHTVALALLSLVMMHAFVYAVEFSGQEGYAPEGAPWWSSLLRYTVAGYAVCLLMSLYVLWSFGRIDGMGAVAIIQTTVVLGFPAAVGAAAARLIL